MGWSGSSAGCNKLLHMQATKEGVTVREVTDTQLALTTSNTSSISWVFEVTSMVSRVLNLMDCSLVNPYQGQ